MISAEAKGTRPFQFERDTFAFAHELVWRYDFDAETGQMTTVRADPPPTYYHRCFVLVRAVRQFFCHAHFDPDLPAPDAETCRGLVRAIVARNPRQASQADGRVVIPGYEGLRSFSRAWEQVLKAECGGPWESYFLRSHWRMVAPTGRRHQERVAQQLAQALLDHRLPLVHLFRFPRITINHGIVLFGAADSERDIQFDAYDPNIPEHPVKLIYERATRTFVFPRTHYWAGGALNVYEIYTGGLY